MIEVFLTLIALVIGAALSYGFWAVPLKVKLERSLSNESLLEKKLQNLRTTSESMLDILLSERIVSERNVSQQSKNLVRLAINNTNENEARNAAMQACKKIAKDLSLK